MNSLERPSAGRTLSRLVVALFFVFVGLHHGIDPEPYLAIMPPYLPWHLELVYLSGVFEVLGGLGLLLKRTRRWAAWGLLALLVAVYPANIHMLVNDVYLPDMPEKRWLLWVRMPMQFVFAAAVLWAGELWPRAEQGAAQDEAGQGPST